MKCIRFIAIAFAAVIFISCAEKKDKGLTELTQIEIRWFDGLQVASSTPKIAMGSHVSNLQMIRRDLDNIEVSDCLLPAKLVFSEDMRVTINGFLEFMRGNQATSKALLSEFPMRYENYKSMRDSCIEKRNRGE